MARPPIDSATLARIAASIRAEMGSIDRVVSLVRDALLRHGESQPETLILHGLAGLVHDFYTGIEKTFRTVTPALNGVLSEGESWHRELLRSSTLDLPGLRPAIVRQDTAARLQTYLAFRHLYRNLYAFELRWDRVRALAEGVEALWVDVRVDLDRFLAFLDETARG